MRMSFSSMAIELSSMEFSCHGLFMHESFLVDLSMAKFLGFDCVHIP